MCLLITAAADVGRDLEEHWLEDFHWYNSDGYGIMFAIDGKLHVYKSLGDAEQFKKDWRHFSHIDRAVHLRMRTHGEVNLVNCHPYWVIENEIALMHNGILSNGNNADKTMSDTWHYIQDYLRPLLLRDPELFLQPAFQAMLGEAIGDSNRFVLLDRFGHMVTVNESTGVTWRDMWLSNEYAWSSPNNKFCRYQTVWDDDQDYSQFRNQYPASPDYIEDAEHVPHTSSTELAKSIHEVLMMLESYYYDKAAAIDKNHFITFAVQRGDDRLWDAAEALIDGELDESQFCTLIKNGTLYADNSYNAS